MQLLYRILFFIVFLSCEAVTFSQGCSTCRAQIINSSKDDFTVGNGLNIGILFLMIIPYIILFFLFRKQLVNFYKTIKSKS
tara:strand:+ start:1510 stop:1752 length:243 start_codon:yes stop_codon:yes gene_type:complete